MTLMETIYDKLAVLTKEYTTWCTENNLPSDRSADELLYFRDGPPLTDEQKSWLIDFIDRWTKADTK